MKDKIEICTKCNGKRKWEFHPNGNPKRKTLYLTKKGCKHKWVKEEIKFTHNQGNVIPDQVLDKLNKKEE